MKLNDLIVRSEQLDTILFNDDAVKELLTSNDKIGQLVGLLEDQVNNKTAEAVLLLDNYIIVDGEEISLYEARVKEFYLEVMLRLAATFGETEKFAPIIDYRVKISTALHEAFASIEVPEPEPEETE